MQRASNNVAACYEIMDGALTKLLGNLRLNNQDCALITKEGRSLFHENHLAEYLSALPDNFEKLFSGTDGNRVIRALEETCREISGTLPKAVRAIDDYNMLFDEAHKPEFKYKRPFSSLNRVYSDVGKCVYGISNFALEAEFHGDFVGRLEWFRNELEVVKKTIKVIAPIAKIIRIEKENTDNA